MNKAEEETKAFALVALIPKQLIKMMICWNPFEDGLLPVKLLKQRQKILELYGI